MKYIVILGDGMGDRPLEALGNKTTLEAANKKNMDFLAQNGNLGLTKTLTDDMPLGSDVANMAILGLVPKNYYTGRSPIEALGLNIALSDSDMVFRANLVSLDLTNGFDEAIMLDHSSDKITDFEAGELINFLNHELLGKFKFYFGASYRNILVYDSFEGKNLRLIAPHDILTKKIAEHLPKGEGCEILLDIMKKSAELLSKHPVNLKRVERGLKPANCVWLWGEGKKPKLPSFYNKYKLKSAMITAVPLLSGLANGMGLDNIHVEGATGDINTNFEGKAEASIDALKNGYDFVFVHIEAPDECGHDGNVHEKVLSIEYIDKRVLEPILSYLQKCGEPFKILLTPDHATPICLRTHTTDDIPFVLYDSTKKGQYTAEMYSEIHAKNTGYIVENGYELMDIFLKD